jgi:hypothetical protein
VRRSWIKPASPRPDRPDVTVPPRHPRTWRRPPFGEVAVKPRAEPIFWTHAVRDRVPFYTSQEETAKEKAPPSDFPLPWILSFDLDWVMS